MESCRDEKKGARNEGRVQLTKPLLGRASTLNYFDKPGAEWFDGWDVVCEDTHVTSGSREIDLHDVCGGEYCLQRIGVMDSSAGERDERIRASCGRTRESLILSVASAYPRRPKIEERGARRATEETRRSADIIARAVC